MTPRLSDRPDGRAWMLPRHGVRASLACWALAWLLALALLALWHNAASGDAPAQPIAVESVAVYRRGRLVCHSPVAPDGHYIARHCVAGGPVVLPDGIQRAYSVDPVRDIAHIEECGQSALLGTAKPGDLLAWHNERTNGTAILRRVTTASLDESASHWEIDTPGQPMWILCGVSGGLMRRGDSGTGYGNSNGELAALFVGGDLDGPLTTTDCGPHQRVFAVPVP